MERYENIIKMEEIRRLIDEKLYTRAAKIMDTMDISRIKALTDVSILADVLTQNERYEEAMELLIKIYNKSKTRRVLYQLVDISIKMEDLDTANEYLNLYEKVAPTDSQRYIFRYCIDKLSQEPYKVLLESLEQLKEYDYIEMWAYELAKVYHKAGMKDKCVRECSDIILWFGEGAYVEKAKLLKAFYVGDINPVHMAHAKNNKEALRQLDLEKTKDYSTMREEINQYLAKEEQELKLNKLEEDVNDLAEQEEVIEDSIVEADQTDDNLTYVAPMEEIIDESIEKEVVSDIFEKVEELVATEIIEKVEELVEADTVENVDEIVQAVTEEVVTEDDTGITNTTQEVKADVYEYLKQADFSVKNEFGAFLSVHGLQDQIQYALENILSDSDNINHLVITGSKKSGKSTLGKKICKGLFALNWIKSPKIAKITGERIDKANISSQKNNLRNTTIIIENAGDMTEEGCKKLSEFLIEMRDSVFVILEDDKQKIEALFIRCPFLSKYFSNQINIGGFTQRELFEFASLHISNQNYQFLSDAKTMFFQKIGQILTENKEPLEAVINLAKATVKVADNRYKSQLSEILNTRSFDTEDLIYIVKEDIMED